MKEKKNMIEQAMARLSPRNAQPVGDAPATGDEQGLAMLANDLYALAKDGSLPEGFDLQAACADAEFAALANEYGVAAAVRIWAAEKRAEEAESSAMARVSRQMQQRKALPRSMSGGGYASPRPDYANMDSETFKRLSESFRRSARDGKRVPL